MNRKYHRYLLLLSLFLLAGALTTVLFRRTNITGILIISGLISLAWGVRGYNSFKGFSYTLWIFTAVAASMFYPQYFIQIGNFQFKKLIVPLLQVIMFGMGSQMSFEDFKGVIKMPKGVLIAIFSHYTIMPLVGFSIARIFNFPPEIAAGIILIGCVPSGLASNVMSFLARANLALAVTISAVTTLISPFITPFLMKWLGRQFIAVDFWSMMLDILNMIILPVIAGFTFNIFARKNSGRRSMLIQLAVYPVLILLTTLVYAKSNEAGLMKIAVQFLKSLGWFYVLPAAGAIIISRFLKPGSKVMEKSLSFISMAGIAVIVTVITASGRDSLLKVGALLIVTSLLHNLTGYTLGYAISWLLRLPEKDRRTVAFEVGMQNGGLASGLAMQMGKIATVGLAPAIFGPLMNITGSVLANWWRGRPAGDEEPDRNDSDKKTK